MPKFEPIAPQFVRILSGDTSTGWYANNHPESIIDEADAVLHAIASSKYGIVSQREIADMIERTRFAPCELTAMLDALVTIGAIKMERTVGARQFWLA